MFDTVRLEVLGVDFGEDFQRWADREYPGADWHVRRYRGDFMPWNGVNMLDPVLGTLGVRSNRQGTSFWVERSLPKFLYGDNCRMLTVEEAREGLDHLLTGVRARFSDWWLFPDTWYQCVAVKRLDLCYDRHLPSAAEAFAHIARCVRGNQRAALRLTGVEIHQSRFEHCRFYDKGLESGNEQYQDVVRHEEQLRGGKAAYLLPDLGKLEIKVEDARAHMNKRFQGWASSEFECYGFEQLLAEHGVSGAAAIALAEHPEFEPMYRRNLADNTFYKYRTLALDVRRRMSKLDLRVPDDAWQTSSGV